MLLVLLLVLPVLCVNGIVYDAFYGTPLTDEEIKRHEKENTTFWCTNDITPCETSEGRRVDGSCNNLNHPTRGAPKTPFYRVLPAVYDKNFEPRKSKSGDDLPLSRRLRTNLLSEGYVADQKFTQLLTHYLVFMASEVTGPHDTINFVFWRPYCCAEKGKSDYMCAPNKVPDDDPVHRFTDIRCMNMTKPITFQSSGCIQNDTVPERLDTSTPLFELSNIYGKDYDGLNKLVRKFEGGLLKYEVENGRVWPPSYKSKGNVCYENQKPFETRCHATPNPATNSLLGINLLSIWFWRLHNYIAKELQNINPCWNDEKLFATAKDINIAFAVQIYYYELLATFMGRDNLIRDGVLSPNSGFRDLYNDSITPQMSLEYPFVLRWVHTLQEGIVRMYDNQGNYMKKIPYINITLRTGYLALDNNLDYITQSSFRQGSAKIDYIVDPDIAELGLPSYANQKAIDITTNDLAKNRHFGFPPYVKYREHCFKKRYNKFGDLKDAFDPENLERLKDVYENFEDIDLLAGIWLEKYIDGGHVPQTLYCLVVEYLVRHVVTDRHWYERPNRPNAFNRVQLQEIRKMTMAHLLCLVGDSVTHIQPNAFLRASEENRIGSCNELAEIDFWAWEDNDCEIEYDLKT